MVSADIPLKPGSYRKKSTLLPRHGSWYFPHLGLTFKIQNSSQQCQHLFAPFPFFSISSPALGSGVFQIKTVVVRPISLITKLKHYQPWLCIPYLASFFFHNLILPQFASHPPILLSSPYYLSDIFPH